MSPVNRDDRLTAPPQVHYRRRKDRSRRPNGQGMSSTFRPELQALEDRTVLDVTLSKGLLLITGTAGNDTAVVQQVAPKGGSGDQISVSLNGLTSTFKVSQVTQITANLLAGSDTITLDESVKRVTPPLSFDGGGGPEDKLVYMGTTSADAIAVSGSTIALTGSGTLTYSNFESVEINALVGTDTATLTLGTLSGKFTVRGATVTNSSINTVAAGALLDVSEVPLEADAGLLSNSTFGTVLGEVKAGSIVNTSFNSIAPGGSVLAAGQGTTTNVSIGTLSGSFTAPEDSNTGSGVMSNTTISTITSTGSVSTGSISGMTVGTAASGSSITAAGQGTTTNVSIGTLSGSFTAPEDSNTGSGVMSNTTISTITSTGSVSTGSISGMTVGTADSGSSITAAGQGTISNISIGALKGLLSAEKDNNPGSGAIIHAAIGTFASTGAINAGGAVTDLTVVTIEGGDFTAGTFGTVSAQHVTANAVKLVGSDATRTIQLVAVAGFARPAEFSFQYDGTGSGNPKVSVQVNAGVVSNARGDLSLLSDTVGKAGSGIDLVSLTASGKAYLRNVVVAGNLTPAAGTFAVDLPSDIVAVAAAGNIPAGSIRVLSTPAVAAGFFNGVAAASAKTTDAAGLFVPGTTTTQANDTFQVFVGDGTSVAMFLVTGSNGSNFDGKNVLFTDQGLVEGAGQFRPVTASVGVASGSASVIRTIALTGEGASLQTQQFVSTAIVVTDPNGSLGDVTLSAPSGTPADITAPRIVGNIDVTNGSISGTISTTSGDIGRAIADANGNIVGVTFIRAGAGGLTTTGKILSAANLVSQIQLQSSLDGVVAVQGDIGVIKTQPNGDAVVGTGPGSPLTRFGGINVSTGGVKGSIIALGNVFGDINVNGGLDGRIAVKGRTVAGLDPSRIGILGNVSIGGGVNSTAAIVSAGRIGDDGITDATRIANDSVGTKLSISGAVKGIIAAVDDINYGSIGNTTAASLFENVGPGSTDGLVIASIFTDGGVALTIPDGLSLILTDLGFLRVGADGHLTVSPT